MVSGASSGMRASRVVERSWLQRFVPLPLPALFVALALAMGCGKADSGGPSTGG
jgi:hypothetical protein